MSRGTSGVGALLSPVVVWGCLVGFVVSFGVLLVCRRTSHALRVLNVACVLCCVRVVLRACSFLKEIEIPFVFHPVLQEARITSGLVAKLGSPPACKHTLCFLSSGFF